MSRLVRLVIHMWMVLGAVVGQVGVTRSPIITELILIFAASEPIEAHVHQLGASGHDSVVCDTGCR